MERMTSLRVNGIKTGYWSAENKETLVQRLAAYENTGLTPEEIADVKAGLDKLERKIAELINSLDPERK